MCQKTRVYLSFFHINLWKNEKSVKLCYIIASINRLRLFRNKLVISFAIESRVVKYHRRESARKCAFLAIVYLLKVSVPHPCAVKIALGSVSRFDCE